MPHVAPCLIPRSGTEQYADECNKLCGDCVSWSILDTPEQAIACFDRTDMDVLVLGRVVLIKPDYAAKTAP